MTKKSRPWFHKCNFCNKRVSYRSIEQELGATLKRFGFPYKLSDFETLSYKSYSCTNCGSSDRDRLYKIYIEKFVDLDKKAKILDFAPSKQLEKYLRPKYKGYRSADLLIDGVDDKVDITNMTTYKDSAFDFFICSHVLEHVDDDMRAMFELYRVLKPNGRGIIMTPVINKPGVQDEDASVTSVSERWQRFAQYDHVRLYERSVFLSRLKDTGFEVKIYGYWNLGAWSMIRNGINFKSRLYIVSKAKEIK